MNIWNFDLLRYLLEKKNIYCFFEIKNSCLFTIIGPEVVVDSDGIV
jgi:hypothetical protein